MPVRGGSKGRKKLTLRDFTREMPSREEDKRFRDAMNAESDLVTAMLQAIEVDYLLERALIMVLARRDQGTIDLLSKDNGPFATFYAKITLGYAMGLFDEAFMEYLHTVRRIRNAFAHARKDISFATPLIRNEMAGLKLPPDSKADEHKNIGLVKRLTATLPRSPPAPRALDALTGRAACVILCLWIGTVLRSVVLSLFAAKRGAAEEDREDGK